MMGRALRCLDRQGAFVLPVLLWLVGCSADQPPADISAPTVVEFGSRMVSTPSPWATDVAHQILDAGGNAMDAAVAAKMVLGFVEAPETGLGGGGFLMYYRSDTGNTRIYDGREIAPAATTPYRFTILGRPAPLWWTIPQGQAVGVPGTAAMLGRGHSIHGELDWADLLAPAIELAEQGVPMPPRLQQQVAEDLSLRLFSDTRRYFRAPLRTAEARKPPALVNQPLAELLKALAEFGPEHFYQAGVADQIIHRARNRHPGASDLVLDDFLGYEAEGRDPVCAPYRRWTVCGPPPPSSGGIAVLQILGMLSEFELADMAPGSAEAIHLITEATRLAFADRNHYIGDPAFVDIPVDGLLDAVYLSERASLIRPDTAMARVWPGLPAGAERPVAPFVPETPQDGTSHLTIVDDRGHIAVVTTSNEAPFGSRMMALGMVLNNQLTDFTFDPGPEGQRHPNAPAPGKRPRSSMAPIIVFNSDDRPILALGSRGGSRIIGYVAQTLVEVLDWGVPLNEAVTRPRFVFNGQNLDLEADTTLAEHLTTLKEKGHSVQMSPLTSGLHGVQRADDQWLGAADPRLDGVASASHTGFSLLSD